MPTNGWRLSCTDCSFESATSGRDLAESMASTHRSSTGHDVEISEQTPDTD
ncbi:hypothetical protein [Halomarina oriensis]|uniref:DUF1059 domain-containing protein n=1 Tax=Halomarina oriensis TaxID=671145 RepID=A0A6B0GN53_9EURY|nr:hypothetical protein [Halomarina oriensis]MWG36356.1 hypothetical protein [Halomarina oriensis]